MSYSNYGLALLSEVESLCGKQIFLSHDSKLEGLYYVNLDSALISHREINPTADGCVHELSHLKLIKLGCPEVLLRRERESNRWVLAVSHFLNDLFEHHIFFPELVANGFSPYTNEESGLASQLEKIVNEKIHLKPPSNSPSLEYLDSEFAFFAIVYARAFLECESPQLREKCITIFSTPYLSKSVQLGEELIQVVRLFAVHDFKKVKMGMEKSLELLSLARYLKVSTAPQPVAPAD